MKYLDEYRDGAIAGKIADEIRRTVTRPWVLMEVCGGQTHSIVKYGLDALARGGGAPRARLQGISEESGVPLVARHDVMPPPERQKIGEANTSIGLVQAGLQVGDLGSVFVILLFVLGIPGITAHVEDELLPAQVIFRIVDQFFEGRQYLGQCFRHL